VFPPTGTVSLYRVRDVLRLPPQRTILPPPWLSTLASVSPTPERQTRPSSRAGPRSAAPTKASRPRAGGHSPAPRLRVQDLDFAMNQIVVRDGKGAKDRLTMLPAMAKAALARHLQSVKRQYEADLAHGAGWVELPSALARSTRTPPRVGRTMDVRRHPDLRRPNHGPAPPPSPHEPCSSAP
jgi:integrase